MVNKVYNKIIPFLILIQPLFDILTSIMVKFNYNVTLGIIIKLVLMIFCIIYLIFYDKRNRKNNFFFLSFLFVFSIINIILNIDIIKIQIFNYFSYMIKYIYIVIILLYFNSWFKNGNSIKLYQLRIPLLLISIFFVLSIITNTAFFSYDSARRGISGWYNSANEFGNLLSLLFPISLFNAFHNKEGKKIDFVLFIFCGIMMLSVGTKVGLLGYILTLICYIIYRILIIKKNKLDYKFLLAIVILILPLIFWKELPTVYNTNFKIENSVVNENVENVENNINSIILSGRDEFAAEIKKNRTNISAFEILFGKSYITENNTILIAEQDFLDIYNMYGIIGLGILIMLFIYTLLVPIKYFFCDLKNSIYNKRAIFCIISVFLVISISYISGHVLLSPSVSTYLTLVFVILCEKCNKNQSSMDNTMIIYMPKLSVGGMEQALINLLNMSDFKTNYKIDLYLGYSVEKKYLKSIPDGIKVHLLCKGKWNLFSKILVGTKMICTYINLLVNPYKYDVSICYAYQHGILSKLARLSSKNNIIFVHNDLLKCRTPDELKKLKRKVRFEKFAKIVCVSNGTKKSFNKVYPNYDGKIFVINNYINGDKILTLSKEKVTDLKKAKDITFINIGRHEEKAKKITRIIEASEKLFNEGYIFRVILVGDGQDHNLYSELIKKKKLTKKVFMLGKKVNPYPYLKLSDCFILSSEYEGYGLVLDESRILNVPIISTDVADSKKIMNEGYGILCENSLEGIYLGMKKYLDKGYKIKNKFDYKKFNNDITIKLNKLVVGDKNEKNNVYF